MRWKVLGFNALALLVLGSAYLVAQEAYYKRTDPFQLVAGLYVGDGATPLKAVTNPSTGVVQLGGTDVTGLTMLAGASTRTVDTNGMRQTAVATQTIGAGGIIAADSCGSRKDITAAAPVTTDTTNSITAPAASNANCIMIVCNVGANAITIDKNANVLLVGGTDVVLAANACITVGSNGTIWRQLTAQLAAT